MIEIVNNPEDIQALRIIFGDIVNDDQQSLINQKYFTGRLINVADESGLTAVMCALIHDSPRCLEWLTDLGAIFGRYEGFGPVANSVRFRSYRALSYMISRGLQRCAEHDDIQEAKRIAAMQGECDSMKMLLGADPDIQAIDSEDGSSLLHLAYFSKQPQMCRLLIDHGANESIRNRSGLVPHEMAFTIDLDSK
jgi:ankyrin repeat protein